MSRTLPSGATVFEEAVEVRSRLRALGLTIEIVREIAARAAAGRAEALEVDPVSAPGWLSYLHGVRGTRLVLLPEGNWRVSRANNVEATVNDELGVQLCFQNVDRACTDADPMAVSGKGAGAREIINSGQGQLFPGAVERGAVVWGTQPTVWMLCVSVDTDRLRAEVSRPLAFDGKQFDGFGERIFVVDEAWTPEPQSRPQIDEPELDFDVPVTKKSGHGV